MKGLNVAKIDENTEKALMGTLIVNLTYYPKCPNPDLTYGVGPHADVSTITVLLQDDTGGLYVRGKEENIWFPVEPVKGALVINIGDVLQIMSNDRYHSIEHRVNTNSKKHRVSVPIFVNPALDAVVATPHEALEIGERALYKPMTYSEYFKYFFSKPHDGKKTIEYAKV